MKYSLQGFIRTQSSVTAMHRAKGFLGGISGLSWGAGGALSCSLPFSLLSNPSPFLPFFLPPFPFLLPSCPLFLLYCPELLYIYFQWSPTSFGNGSLKCIICRSADNELLRCGIGQSFWQLREPLSPLQQF